MAGALVSTPHFHCAHQFGDIQYTIIDWDPPLSFTNDTTSFGAKVWFALQLESIPEGTRIHILFGEPYEGDIEESLPKFQAFVEGGNW